MNNIFNFNEEDGYIKCPRLLACKNKNDVNKFITRNDIDILSENFSYEINVDSLIGRRFLPRNFDIDDGNIQEVYKKIYMVNLNDLVSSDLLYDIELVGNIYRAYVIIDDLIVMKITNNLSKNLNIRIPEFTINNPYPLITTTYTKICIGVEMNSKYMENKNEKIHLNFKGGHLNLTNKTLLMKMHKFNMKFSEFNSLDIIKPHLLFLIGKCIPFIDKTLEYFI